MDTWTLCTIKNIINQIIDLKILIAKTYLCILRSQISQHQV